MASTKNHDVEHPGPYIRQHILPPELSVTKAAQLLGVGRPALSNLLNGKAALSSEMAARLEKAFGANRESLLAMQAAYSEKETQIQTSAIAVRTYAPSFIRIKAADIEAWANTIDARSRLSVLLRILINTTGHSLTKVDFPGYDNAQKPGWDGEVRTDAVTPWIPAGISGWEFGCNADPQDKADEDYSSRTNNTAPSERAGATFTFVTPRNWRNKEKWLKSKRSEKKWKDVVAYDANDLEQWLEQSLPAQNWLAHEIGRSFVGASSLAESWDRWSRATKPRLDKELFRTAIDNHKNGLAEWLSQAPTRPFVIAADSKEEALAFTACILEECGDWNGKYHDQTIVLASLEAFNAIARSTTSLIAVVANADIERSMADFYQKKHTIIIRNRYAVNGDVDIVLSLLDDKTFRLALGKMGMNEDDVSRLARESGHSLTVLRRRLAQIPEIKSPPWTNDTGSVRNLIPLLFAGTWDSKNRADQQVLACLADGDYEQVERAVSSLLQIDHSPVWTLGTHRGLVSKIDALFSIHRFITTKDIEDFLLIAQLVLSEEDPALDLPEEKRWAANIYGKSRNHSSALRGGICETLVLLSVHGNNLLKTRLGIDIETRVNLTVRELLTPFNSRTWQSQQHDLPRYAEASPEEFLRIVENDLNAKEPQILSLLKPVKGGLFSNCARTGLLWSLELLAWKPERLVRVASILARLSAQKIDDNWANKPSSSLASIFRSWMPQTAATLEQRIAALEIITQRFPEIGWAICREQVNLHNTIGTHSYRPKWRNDAEGAGQPVSGQENFRFRRKALDLLLSRPAYDEKSLGDLIEIVHTLPADDQKKIWDFVQKWAATGPSDNSVASLRERIRKFALTRRGKKLNLSQEDKALVVSVYERLTPKDVVVQHQWLFAQHWVEESRDELDTIQTDGYDFEKRQAKIDKLRTVALQEIWAQQEYRGVLRLCEGGNAPYVIGFTLAKILRDRSSVLVFIEQIASEKAGHKYDFCLAGFLNGIDATERQVVVEHFRKVGSASTSNQAALIRILKACPFAHETWLLVAESPRSVQLAYWGEVLPGWAKFESGDNNFVIDRLLEAGRPLTAFGCVHFNLAEIDSSHLIRLLEAMAQNHSEVKGANKPDSYHIGEAIKILNKRTDVTRDQMAQLEFIYLQALEHSEHGIPNLARQLADNPMLFAQAIVYSYKRSDDGVDPPELQTSDENTTRFMAIQSHALLDRIRIIPGTRQDGSVDAEQLKKWISSVRESCKNYAREAIGDLKIGELLARCAPGNDGIWPCEPVRQVLEELGTEDMGRGMATGFYNLKEATWHGSHGHEERQIARRYMEWSKQIAYDAPFSANVLETVSKFYDSEADWWDTDSDLQQRIRH